MISACAFGHIGHTSFRPLQQWLIETRRKVSAKSELAAAINYALKRWAALTRYCEDGSIEIDNNAAERTLRGPVLSSAGSKLELRAGGKKVDLDAKRIMRATSGDAKSTKNGRLLARVIGALIASESGSGLITRVKPLILAQPTQKGRCVPQRAMLGGPLDVFGQAKPFH